MLHFPTRKLLVLTGKRYSFQSLLRIPIMSDLPTNRLIQYNNIGDLNKTL